MLSKIYTLNQLTNVLSDAQSLRPALMKASEPNWKKLESSMNPDSPALLIPRLSKAKNQLTELDKIVDELNAHQLVEITTAIELSSELVETIGIFLKQHIGEQVVFSNLVNPRLVGGAQVSFQGKFRDYSLASTLDHYFQSTKII